METTSEPLIRTRELSKVYRIYPSPWARLWEALTRRPRHRRYPALSDVSFDLRPGEGLAIIGENGAGKSTLLKILAGVTPASSGTAEVRGQVASILELGSGFHPELTGRQNIVLNAAMLGLSDAEVRERTPAIIEFSELGAFIDQPVKSYSTGMAMRLGFAIATQVEPDVLIIDEALSVGDGYFQKKCMDLMLGFLDDGGTLLFCSHAMYYVAAFCRRALWLKDGRVEALGPAESVIRDYETYLMAKSRKEAASEEPEAQAATTAEPGAAEPGEAVGPARLRTVDPHPGDGSGAAGAYRRGDSWSLDVAWDSDDPDRKFHLAVGIDRVDDVQVLVMSSHHAGLDPWTGDTSYRARLEVPALPMVSGSYNVQVYLLDEAALHVYDQRKLRNVLEVEADTYRLGLVETDHVWVRDAAA